MGERVRAQLGSALPSGERQGAPGPEHEVDDESMSMGIRELVVGWAGQSDSQDDEERLAALRRGRLRHETHDPRGDRVLP